MPAPVKWSPAEVSRRIVVSPNGCWLWQQGCDGQGYGRIRVRLDGRRRHFPAHRFIYQLLIGPVPMGLQLDHMCHDRATCAGGPSCHHRRCVNPEHLRPSTAAENSGRSLKIACLRGHPYPESARYYNGGRGRYCAVCNRDAVRRYSARRREGRP